MMREKRANNIYQRILRLSLISVCLLGGSIAAFAQNKWAFEDDGCGNTRWSNQSPYGANNNGAFDLQIKEQTLAAPPKNFRLTRGEQAVFASRAGSAMKYTLRLVFRLTAKMRVKPSRELHRFASRQPTELFARFLRPRRTTIIRSVSATTFAFP